MQYRDLIYRIHARQAILLVNFDTVALDCHPVTVRLGMLLQRLLDGLHLLWLDQRRAVFN